MSTPDDVRRAHMDGLAEGALIAEEGLAVIAAAMDCVAVILAQHPAAADVDNPWFHPTTLALVAAVQRFASTEQHPDTTTSHPRSEKP